MKLHSTDKELSFLSQVVPVDAEGYREIIEARKNCFVYMEYRSRYGTYESPETAEEMMLELATALNKIDMESMHILRCMGVVYQSTNENKFVFLYDLPSGPQPGIPWTLDEAIEDGGTPMPPLDVRIRFAIEAITAVMFVHASGLVHKSIYPNNILSEFRVIVSHVPEL